MGFEILIVKLCILGIFKQQPLMLKQSRFVNQEKSLDRNCPIQSWDFQTKIVQSKEWFSESQCFKHKSQRFSFINAMSKAMSAFFHDLYFTNDLVKTILFFNKRGGGEQINLQPFSLSQCSSRGKNYLQPIVISLSCVPTKRKMYASSILMHGDDLQNFRVQSLS